jgi:hypothetical protein
VNVRLQVDTSIDAQGLRDIRTDFALVLLLFVAHVALLIAMVTALLLPHSTDGMFLNVIVLAWALAVIALAGWTLRVMLFQVRALHRDGEYWMVHRLFGRSVRLPSAPPIRRLGMKLPSLWAPYVRSAWWVAAGPCVITDRLPGYRDALRELGYIEA